MKCPHCEKEFTAKELTDFQKEYQLQQEFEARKKQDIRVIGLKAVILFVLGLILVGVIVQELAWFFKTNPESLVGNFSMEIVFLTGLIFDLGLSVIFYYSKKEKSSENSRKQQYNHKVSEMTLFILHQ